MRSAPTILAAVLVTALAAGTNRPALAQGTPLPAGTQDVGPWEAVLWAHAGKVDHCTLSRARSAPPGVSYGWFIDGEMAILGIEARSWRLTPGTSVEMTITPQRGSERRMAARAVMSSRANLEVGKDRSLLEDLQRSEHAEVRIGGVAVRLAFDDFNAARVVLEACVQRIGAPIPPHDIDKH